jgi:hypothetical protein
VLLECTTTAITGVPLEALEGEGSSHLIDSANVTPSSDPIKLFDRPRVCSGTISPLKLFHRANMCSSKCCACPFSQVRIARHWGCSRSTLC